MCGIAGMMRRDGGAPDRAVLERMAAAIRHRGPDNLSIRTLGPVGLVHARLSIVDLETGDQPLEGPGGELLIANGEIYNDLELRAGELASCAFRTRSDCEPILHLYRRYGRAFAEHLRGMWAIALFDPREGRLVLSRDPFGIKPLYYAETAEALLFASESQALIASGLVAPELSPGAAEEVFQLQFTTGTGTIFRGVSRVLPGETLTLEAGAVRERRRRAALPSGPRLRIGEAEALNELDGVLMDSIAVHRRSDVPFGIFLSSGVDSATVLYGLSRLSPAPVVAYTASFPGTKLADEFPQAHRVARALGARHVNVKVVREDLWRELPAIAAAVDDPTADYAIVPTYLLARQARKDVKVVLCGEGGDEVFAGYGRYRRQARPRLLGGRERNPNGPFTGRGVLRQETLGWREGVVAAKARCLRPDRSRLQVAQAMDCEESLPNALLTKLDRCLMAHGVEGRTPFLDPVVARFGYLLPENLKLARGRGKYLLRRWLSERVPQAEPFARKKGFTVPVGEWILAEGARLGPLVAADPGVAAYCRPEAVEALFVSRRGDDQIAAWRLLFFALWHRRHVRGLAPEEDVFACLARPNG